VQGMVRRGTGSRPPRVLDAGRGKAATCHGPVRRMLCPGVWARRLICLVSGSPRSLVRPSA
jgi:hypothetical protein